MEGDPIDKKSSNRSSLLRRIVALAGVALLAGFAILCWRLMQEKKYEDAYRLGLNAWKQKQPERALEEWRKAAEVDPRPAELWVRIGRAELALGRADRALEAWEEALRREPGFKPALFERGKEALGRHISRRIPPPLDPSSGWLPLRLEAENAGAELQRIRADLKEGAESSPECARFVRGATDLLEGRAREAEPRLRAYTEPNAWDAGALALLGIAGRYGGFPDRAEQALSEALALRNESLWSRLRAEARYLQGNLEGARADFKKAGAEKEAEPLFSRRIPSQGLILWLRADAGLEVAGSAVSRWSDQSEGRNDAVPMDAARRPSVTASAVRGRPAVLFSGKGDELRLPDGFEDFGAGLSVFVVGEAAPSAADPWSYLSLATASGGAIPMEVRLGRRRELAALVYSVEDLKSQARPFVAGLEPLKEFEGLGAVQDASGKVRMYRGGALLSTGTLTLPQKVHRARNRVGAGFKGHLAEILLYKRGLSEIERLGVEAYLKERYFSAAPAAEKR